MNPPKDARDLAVMMTIAAVIESFHEVLTKEYGHDKSVDIIEKAQITMDIKRKEMINKFTKKEDEKQS